MIRRLVSEGAAQFQASLSDQAWKLRARCIEVGYELFYPESAAGAAEAKRVCQSCPVRAECLGYALENNERFGVWGGMSERERRLLKRRKRRATGGDAA